MLGSLGAYFWKGMVGGKPGLNKKCSNTLCTGKLTGSTGTL